MWIENGWVQKKKTEEKKKENGAEEEERRREPKKKRGERDRKKENGGKRGARQMGSCPSFFYRFEFQISYTKKKSKKIILDNIKIKY